MWTTLLEISLIFCKGCFVMTQQNGWKLEKHYGTPSSLETWEGVVIQCNWQPLILICVSVEKMCEWVLILKFPPSCTEKRIKRRKLNKKQIPRKKMEDQGRDGRVIFPVRLSLYSVASLVSSFFFFFGHLLH